MSGKTPRFIDGSRHATIAPRQTYPESNYSTSEITGTKDQALLHYLNFRSAYGNYCHNSEPEFTFSSEKHLGTIDYVFYTVPELRPVKLLSLPELQSIYGSDPREYAEIPDTEYPAPQEWEASEKSGQKYTGEWIPPEVRNPQASVQCIPNAVFPSDHVAQLVIFACIEDQCSSTWN